MAEKTDQMHYDINDVKLPDNEKALEKIANSIGEDITIWEGGFFIPAAFFMLGLALLGTAYQNLLIGKIITVVILVALSVFLFVIFFKTILRRRLPYMVLTKEGLVSSVFKTAVPWRGIKDFQINSAKTNSFNIAVGMEFSIIGSFLPEENEKSRSGSYYDEKTKKLMISGFNFRLETNRDTIIEQIIRYRNAAIARHRLNIKKSTKK